MCGRLLRKSDVIRCLHCANLNAYLKDVAMVEPDWGVPSGKERAMFWTVRLTNFTHFDRDAGSFMGMTLLYVQRPIDYTDKWVIKSHKREGGCSMNGWHHVVTARGTASYPRQHV